jgi:hypothetical protein
MALFSIIVLLILATIGDRVANAIAENTIANQFVKNGFPVKPSVTIEGFPFLSQVIAHDIHTIDFSASNVPAGPVSITSVKGKMTGVHINSSFNGGLVNHMTATAFVSFSALSSGLGASTAVTMTPDGRNQLKITANLAGTPVTVADAKISQAGPRELNVQVVPTANLPVQLPGSLTSFSVTLPQGVPASMRITGFSLNKQGLTVNAAATNATLTESKS